MKAIMSLLFCFLSLAIYAQKRYYNDTKVLKEDGYEYQCDVNKGSGSVTLYNKDSRFVNIEQVHKNTGKPFGVDPWHLPPQLERDMSIPFKVWGIICKGFTPEQKQKIQSVPDGCRLSVTLYIDPRYGTISDVKFWFLVNDPYAEFPISVYRKIETELKSQIRFKVTAFGKSYNYLMIHDMYDIE